MKKMAWVAFALMGFLGACGMPASPGMGAPIFGQQAPRALRWNGRAATAQDLQIVAQIEARSGQRIPDGDYWYDNTSGGAGRWGGPAEAVLPAGLGLGGPLPAEASGGGSGGLTGVFINGREIHPVDAQRLGVVLGALQPGRYWVDGNGNAGVEGGPAQVNLYQLARQRGGGNGQGAWTSRTDMLTGNSRDNINGASDGQTTCFTTADRTVCTDGNN